MKLKEFAKSKYLEFASYEGSEHIAGEFAIYRILETIRLFKINSILEVGLGIGTLPNAILNYNKQGITYVGTEANAFCLSSLEQNINTKNVKVYHHLSDVLQEEYIFDLVIIDGKFDDFKNMKDRLSKHAIIIIEGDRMDQENIVRSFFPKSKYVHSISAVKNDTKGVFDSSQWQSGVKVFFINPTFSQLWYFLKMKIRSKLNYRKRRKLRYLNA